MARKPKRARSARGTKGRQVPSHVRIVQSPAHRIVFSEQQLVHLERHDLVTVHFLANDRHYSASQVDVNPDGKRWKTGSPLDEEHIQVREFTVKMPIRSAAGLIAILSDKLMEFGEERLKEHGVEIAHQGDAAPQEQSETKDDK